MNNQRTVIGFNTPSKAKAQEELNNQSNDNTPLAEVGQGDVEKVKMETIARLQMIGDAICGSEFQKFPPQQRQQLLLDFAYFSKVADTIM